MEILSKLFGEKFKKEFEIGGNKVVFQTLSKKEQLQASSVNAGGDMLYQFDAIKVPILARSIVSINGLGWENCEEVKKIVADKKENKLDINLISIIEQVLGDMDGEIINAFYNHYLEIVDEHKKEVEKLKKALPSQ